MKTFTDSFTVFSLPYVPFRLTLHSYRDLALFSTYRIMILSPAVFLQITVAVSERMVVLVWHIKMWY